MDRRAFSLIELVVACLILFLVLSLSLPRQNFLTKKVVQSELKTLRTTIHYLQQKSIASNTTQTLTFSLATNTYTYQQANKTITHTLPRQVKFGALAHTLGPPAKPIRPITHAVSFTKNRILFHPNGTISPGTIYLIDRNRTVMYAITCSVAHVSFLRFYQYGNTGWVLV
ncbi:hypothetical protein KKA53_02230 [Candidatus Dependentiae bacterium]|nr:hypothetical protein [Candidatus Dependentiae bacterium]